MAVHPFLRGFFFSFFLLVLSSWILPPVVRADVTIEFVLDGSGSMWGQLYDQYKIVILKQGMESFLEKAPDDLRIGIRAFGLSGEEGCSNTRLLLPPTMNAYPEVIQAVKKMNPSGQAPIIFALRKGLKDLKGAEGKKLLILIADGRDTCEADSLGAVEKLSQALSGVEIHVIGLGLPAGEDRTELKLLAAKANGNYYNVSNSSQLKRRVSGIVGQTIREEKERLRLLAEEKVRQATLAEKTRLVVEFVSHVPGFFCSGIRLLDLQIDGKPVKASGMTGIGCTDRVRLYDRPLAAGDHTILLQYEKDNHGDFLKSRPESFSVNVTSGKTTRLECRTAGHLLYWGLDFSVEEVDSP
ncbi:MAG: VWA domain-containing protein [Deltaproteobacteria bacterium]|nr:VWA domain-containing protein [Deltaproteobacteria bacterium]